MATATEPTTEAGATAADGAANKTSNKGGGSSSSSSKDYYGYLFEDNKTPTKTLDALLRAIAKHIVRSVLSLLDVERLFARPIVMGSID